MRRELKSSATDEPFVAVLQAKSLQPLPNSQKQSKKVRKQLDFPLTRCILMFGSGLRSIESRFLSSFQPYFSKRNRESAKFQISSFAQVYEIPAQEDYVFVPCWAFLCRHLSRFLAEPTISRMRSVRLFLSLHVGLLLHDCFLSQQ